MSNKRQRSEQFGRAMEDRAALILRFMGYKLLAKRVKTPVGELDLILKKSGQLIFMEVKARKNPNDFDGALEAINLSRIQQAAKFWIAQNKATDQINMRFDAMIFVPRLYIFSKYRLYWPTHYKNITL